MTRRTDLPTAVERARVAGVYGDYAASRRRRRAWAPENPANVCIRRELTGALLDAARPALANGSAVLDVGCGSGWWLRALADEGVAADRLHGVDLLDDRVRAAARRVPGAGVRTADARDLPYADDTFGLVTLVVTLSSLRDAPAIEQALAQVRRVACAHARVLIYDPRLANPLNRNTRLVRAADIDAVLGASIQTTTLTVAPPLVRALRGVAPGAYAPLRSIAPLRTHALRVYEVS